MREIIKQTRGFTLIELLVVVAIVGLLASIVLASVSSARAKGRDARRAADIRQIQNALELYYNANSRYPAITENECGGTEGYTTTGNNFMQSLVSAGLMQEYPRDPAGTNCNMQYVDNGGQGYVIFVKWEKKAASGCNPAGGNHAAGWSCIGINMNPNW